MKDLIKLVEEFNQAFEVNYSKEPTPISITESGLRKRLMEEETEELFIANMDRNNVEILDALADQLYILLGNILKHGMQEHIEDAFYMVHSSNMAKLHNGRALRRPDGKIIKPKDWIAPDLGLLFKKYV